MQYDNRLLFSHTHKHLTATPLSPHTKVRLEYRCVVYRIYHHLLNTIDVDINGPIARFIGALNAIALIDNHLA